MVVWYEILFHTTPYHSSIPNHEMPIPDHEMQCAHGILTGNMQDLLSPVETSREILIRLLKSPVILHLDKSITVNPLYKSTHYNSKIPYNVTGIFSVYLRGHLWAPVPMQNTLFFPILTEKIPNQKIKF